MLTRRNKLSINFSIAGVVDLHDMIGDLSCTYAIKVEVSVVCKIAVCILVGNCIIIDLDRISAKRVFNSNIELSGVTLFSICRRIEKCESVSGVIEYIPYLSVKADLTAMKVISSVVCVKRIGNTIQSKLRTLDTVTISTYERTLICSICEHTFKSVVSRYNVDSLNL